jgi:hypothetical protein
VRPQAQRAQGVPECLPQVELGGVQVEPTRLDLREVEHVVDEPQQRLRRVLEGEHVLPLLGGQGRVEQQLGHPDDGVHRGPDLVAHVGEEVALGPARRDRGLPRQLQLLRHPPLLGDVARHRVDETLPRHRRRPPREPAERAVLAQVAVLEEDGAGAARQRPCLGRRGVAVVRVDEVDVGPRHQLRRGEAECPLPGGVQPPERAVDPGDAQHVERCLEERGELRLRALTLDELADLARDRGEHLEELLVGAADLPAEELEDPDHLAPEKDRKAEGGVKALPRGERRAREVVVVDDVGAKNGWRLAQTRPGRPIPGANAASRLARSNSGKAAPGVLQLSAQRRTPWEASTCQSPAWSQPRASQIAGRMPLAACRSDDDSARARATAYWACSRRTASFSGSGFMRVEPTANILRP